MPTPDLPGGQVGHSDMAEHLDKLGGRGLGALASEHPAFVTCADEQRADDVVRTIPIALPGCFLDLRLSVLQPVIDGFGYQQVRSLGGKASSDHPGDELVSPSDGFLVRLNEDLLPLASHRVSEVHDESGLNDCRTRCKDAGPISLRDGRCERHGYLLNGKQPSEENTVAGEQQFAGWIWVANHNIDASGLGTAVGVTRNVTTPSRSKFRVRLSTGLEKFDYMLARQWIGGMVHPCP
jgi:hypothetical protein